MACEIAQRFMSEHLSDKVKTAAQARAALLGGSIRVTPQGYRLEIGTRSALVNQWRFIEAILDELEAA